MPNQQVETRKKNDPADLIIYTMKGCQPCRTIVPKAIEYAKTARLSYRVIDVHSEDPEDKRLSAGILWAPTLILHGKEVDVEELAELAKKGDEPR